MVESYFEKMMPAEVVVGIYILLNDLGVELWIDGGWSVDALLGQQTRPHKDLDIAIQFSGRMSLSFVSFQRHIIRI